MALPDEADLDGVINRALALGKRLYIPKVNPENSTMEFFQYSGETERGAFNIQEPSSTSTDKTKPFCPEKETEPTLVLVPGRAFTPRGLRLGRGKGFYDKYLSRFFTEDGIKKGAVFAGVCLHFQLLSELPADEHDIRMDFIFQE